MRLLCFILTAMMAVSAGRDAIVPERPPINDEPLAVYDAEPVEVPLPEDVPVIEEEPKEPVMTYLGTYYVTGYDLCVQCCGKTDGITASGAVATVGRTVACNSLPFGTRIYIDGIGERVVEDRGGMADNVIDVLCEDHPACYAITGQRDVWLIED